MTGQAGRPQEPIRGYGPAAEFARALRRVHEAAGSPKNTRVSKQGGMSTGNVSLTLNGRKVPTWTSTERFLHGCGITDPEVLDIWRTRRDAAERAAERAAAHFTADLDGVTRSSALIDALAALLDGLGLSIDEVAATTRQPGDVTPEIPPLCGHDIAAVLVDRAEPLTPGLLAAVLVTAGAAQSDIDRWVARLSTVARDVPAPGVGAPRAVPTAALSASGRPARSAAPIDGASTAVSLPAASRQRFGWLTRPQSAVLAGVLVTAIAVSVAMATWRRPSNGRQGPAADQVTSAPLHSVPADGTAMEVLSSLAEEVLARSEQPQPGRYTFVHRMQWSVDTTSDNRQETLQDVRLYWDADRSGLRITTTTAPGTTPRVDRENLDPNGLTVVVAEPSDNATDLQRQLAAEQPPEIGPLRWLRAVAAINDYHALTARQRAAVLLVLARVDGISFRGRNTDRLGRAGLAFSADSIDGTTRETVLFDASTGELLSFESDTERPVPTIDSHTVYRDRGHTDTLG